MKLQTLTETEELQATVDEPLGHNYVTAYAMLVYFSEFYFKFI